MGVPEDLRDALADRYAGWLRIDPNVDPLRGNPRFKKLVEGTA